MPIKEKLKKFVKDNPRTTMLAVQAGLAVASVVVYSTVCAAKGYRMTTPHSYTADTFFVKTITGKMLHAHMLPIIKE